MDLQGDARNPTPFRRQLTEQAVTKFIQICASRDDLFALDEDGEVHQYNFNAQTWVKLVATRAREEGP